MALPDEGGGGQEGQGECKRKGHAPPGKLRAQIWLCWWFDKHKDTKFQGGNNFPCAKPVTDEQRAFAANRRTTSKMARDNEREEKKAKKASASNSVTTLAPPASSDDEAGDGNALALARATANQRGRPPNAFTLLNNATRRAADSEAEVQTLKGELASTKEELSSVRDELAGKEAVLAKRNAQIEQYKAEVKAKGDTALQQCAMRQEQQQGSEAVQRLFEAAVLEVCGEDKLAQVKAHFEDASEKRKGVADASWAKVALDVAAMKDATRVAWEAGAVATRSIEAAEKAGVVPGKAKEAVKELKVDIAEHQNAFWPICNRPHRFINKVDAVKLTIDKKAKKAAKEAAKEAAQAAVQELIKAREAEAA